MPRGSRVRFQHESFQAEPYLSVSGPQSEATSSSPRVRLRFLLSSFEVTSLIPDIMFFARELEKCLCEPQGGDSCNLDVWKTFIERRSHGRKRRNKAETNNASMIFGVSESTGLVPEPADVSRQSCRVWMALSTTSAFGRSLGGVVSSCFKASILGSSHV